jgi:hypothetical protein
LKLRKNSIRNTPETEIPFSRGEHNLKEPPLKKQIYEKVFFIPDVHCYFEDKKAIELTLKLVKHFKPDRVIQLGDLLDGYGLSRFDIDPSNPASRLQTELDIAHSFLSALRKASPKSRIQIIEGNHEDRFQKYLVKNSPALLHLQDLTLPKLLKLSEHRIDPVLYPSIDLASGAFTARHGTYTSLTAAKQEFLATLKSGISAHTHRASTFMHRSESGLFKWIECGHLSVNAPVYKKYVQNWVQAIAFGEFSVNGNSFDVHLVPYRIDYQARFDGKLFSV